MGLGEKVGEKAGEKLGERLVERGEGLEEKRFFSLEGKLMHEGRDLGGEKQTLGPNRGVVLRIFSRRVGLPLHWKQMLFKK